MLWWPSQALYESLGSYSLVLMLMIALAADTAAITEKASAR